ncbi:DNA polymerase III subunit delta [Patescibacteria group bacterium]
MIIFLYGQDTYRSHQRLMQLKEAFIKKHDPASVNLMVIEGRVLTIEKLNSAVKSSGLLSKKRMVIVDEVIGSKKSPSQYKELAEYLKNEKIPSDTILLFWEGDVFITTNKTRKKTRPASQPRNPLLKILLDQKHAEGFNQLAMPQLKNWVAKRFKTNGAKTNPQVIDTLISLVGDDLWQLANDIDKLSAYRLDSEVQLEDVKQFVSGNFNATIFALTDALGERDKKTALDLLHRFLENGEPPLYILTMLARQFRILKQVSTVVSEEPNHFTVAKRLKLHPFVAQKAMHQVRRFDEKNLASIYQQLVDLDRQLKTSRDNPELLFDQFILHVCQ